MNSLFTSAPPVSLTQWLLRSQAWTLACTTPCFAVWYVVVIQSRCESFGVIALLTVGLIAGEILLGSRALPGFGELVNAPESDIQTKIMAYGWRALLWIVLLCWTLLNMTMMLGMLLISDDGRGFNPG